MSYRDLSLVTWIMGASGFQGGAGWSARGRGRKGQARRGLDKEGMAGVPRGQGRSGLPVALIKISAMATGHVRRSEGVF